MQRLRRARLQLNDESESVGTKSSANEKIHFYFAGESARPRISLEAPLRLNLNWFI